MRLLHINADGSFSLATFFSNNTPSYAILSHRWEPNEQEFTFEDVTNSTGKGKVGYSKIQFCGEQAKKDDLQYFWVDSCCSISYTAEAKVPDTLVPTVASTPNFKP